MAANGIVREALGDVDARLGHRSQTRVDLCRIPGVSAAGLPPEETLHLYDALARRPRR
jgi:hypothetical protein